MTDETARFAAVLARSVGRCDWWNVYEEHTNYEWACQLALYAVEPWGDRRADIRDAYNTANLIASQPNADYSKDEFADLFRKLYTYLKCEGEQEPQLSDEQAEALARIRK